MTKASACWETNSIVRPRSRETDKQLRVVARTVTPTDNVNAVDADPSDNRILECALAAEAEVTVTGDTHLLSLGSFRDIPIQRVARFLEAFQERR